MSRQSLRSGAVTALCFAAVGIDIGLSWRYGVAMVLVAIAFLILMLGRPS